MVGPPPCVSNTYSRGLHPLCGALVVLSHRSPFLGENSALDIPWPRVVPGLLLPARAHLFGELYLLRPRVHTPECLTLPLKEKKVGETPSHKSPRYFKGYSPGWEAQFLRPLVSGGLLCGPGAKTTGGRVKTQPPKGKR